MNLPRHVTLILGLLLAAELGPAGATQAQDAGPVSSKVELTLVQEDGQVKALSVSVGHGAYVETQSSITDIGIATGVIASVHPVASSSNGGGFDLFTSDLGALAEIEIPPE